jgi:hypothetical protein
MPLNSLRSALLRLLMLNPVGAVGFVVVWLVAAFAFVAGRLGLIASPDPEPSLRFSIAASVFAYFAAPIADWMCRSLSRLALVTITTIAVVTLYRFF